MAEETTLLIMCKAADAQELWSAINSQGVNVQASERRQLDGTQAVSWVLAGTVAIRAVPLILLSLKEFLTRDAIESITVGDITITKPRPEHVQQLLDGVSPREGQ